MSSRKQALEAALGRTDNSLERDMVHAMYIGVTFTELCYYLNRSPSWVYMKIREIFDDV